MPIRLFTPDASHIPILARICYDAFGTLHEKHNVEKDFDTPEVAEMIIGLLMSRPDFFKVAAEVDGEIVGSNFLQMSDPIAGVGPITVKPGTQAKGIGRRLMEAVMEEAGRRGISRVRLQQEAINTASMSLYTKLGFDWRDSCSEMRPAPAPHADPSVRPATAADLPAIDRIGSRQYGATRRNETALAMQGGFPVVVLERAGVVVGYLIPGMFGHGFAETPADMITLIGQAMRIAPPPMQKQIVPFSQIELHRGLLHHGGRTVKMLNYMTVGEWMPPKGAWIPSIGY